MNIKANWLEYLVMVLGLLLITPLQQSVLIPMIENGYLFGILMVWLIVYAMSASRKHERSSRDDQ